MIGEIIDFFMHLDKHLAQIIADYGGWTYAILAAMIFCETGFVVTPFLPGDSLLFAAGALAAAGRGSGGGLNPQYLFVLLSLAGILGNTANYSIGHLIGPRVFTENHRFLKRAYLERTHRFYEKHGGKAVVIGRFIPIIRTFVPFVAGVGAMTYARYTVFNIIGSILWVGLFVYAGYFFGNLEFVSRNFSLVVIAVIAISLVPPVVEVLRAGRRKAGGRKPSIPPVAGGKVPS